MSNPLEEERRQIAREEREAAARLEAQRAIEFAHQAMELVCLLLRDMQSASMLRPTTKAKILEIAREPQYDRRRAVHAFDELRKRLGESSLLEQELKRETPKKQD